MNEILTETPHAKTDEETAHRACEDETPHALQPVAKESKPIDGEAK
jgi:hypothetical protein